MITDPLQINDTFGNYYSDLYTSKSSSSKSDFFDFLNNIDMLSKTAQHQLHADFTLEEIKAAIRSLPNGKACGPDGFGIEFYKAHIYELAPLLFRMIDSSLSQGSFPDTLYDANICLMLKKGRDETKVSSYRPLSILNSYKRNYS